MKRPPRRDVFGFTATLRAIVLVGCGLGVWGLASEYAKPSADRRSFVLYSFLAFAVISLGGVLEAFVGRIELRADEIRVVQLLAHKSYPRTAIVGATLEKGCPVSLKLHDGKWASLPDTGMQ